MALVFSSGMSRRGDFLPAFAVGHSIGIDISECSSRILPELGAAFAGSESRLFVDSGAYAYFRAKERAAKKAKAGKPAKAPKPVDFDRVFDRFHELAAAVCAADPELDVAAHRIHFVMPDVVGDPAAGLELLRKYAPEVAGHSFHAIVPLHSGPGMSLLAYFEAACAALGVLPGAFYVGIPSKAEAVPAAEVAELLAVHGDAIPGIHVLGAASAAKAAGRVAVFEAAGYDGPVSFDANRVRSYWKHCSRKVALERLLAGLPPLRAADVRPAPAPRSMALAF